MKPMRQSHPPRIAEPKERCAVGVFQVPFVRRNAKGTMTQERILSGVCADFDCAFDSMQSGIARIAALAPPTMHAAFRRGITHLPIIPARPKCRHLPFCARWIGE